ncbi:MAG: GGDEF domain-containing protein [Actinomycetales bacterium]|nr:GGDEF domain-containing protein [Actinomycetales bacterium]
MSARTAHFVVVIATGVEEYQAQLLRGMTPPLEANRLGRVVLVDRTDVGTLSADFLRFLRRARPLGVIATHLWRPEHLGDVLRVTGELELPTVVVGSAHPDVTTVRVDNHPGMRELMAHLLDERGIRRPVFVRGSLHQIDSVEREAVYREELTRRGLPVDEELVIQGGFVAHEAHRRLWDLLQRRRDLDGVVAANDLMARGCVTALAEAGLRVPDDVVVAGFDNERESVLWPPLTTIDQALSEQGRVAVEQLLVQAGGDRRRQTLLVPSRLVVRESTVPDRSSPQQQLETALQMMETSRAYVAHTDALANVGRDMLHIRTLDEVVEALRSCLNWLNVRRCFLMLREELFGAEDLSTLNTVGLTEAELDGSPMVRLVLDYRDGSSHAVDAAPFPAEQLLPGPLQSQLADGLLVASSLTLGTRCYGYLLLERDLADTAFQDTLYVDLTRGLDAVSQQQALQAHATRLEETVERRTEELRAEVSMRQRAEQQLRSANRELEALVLRDGLTQVANRTGFEQHLERHWSGTGRTDGLLALLLIDVDYFKLFNDHYGHLAGDQALREIAGCLQNAALRPDDMVARYGGEEFLVILPQSGVTAALTVAARFRAALQQRAIPHLHSQVADVVTVSIGVAVGKPEPGVDPSAMIAAADKALYQAKEGGRDRVVVTEWVTAIELAAADPAC